jgi:hypothetical protein
LRAAECRPYVATWIFKLAGFDFCLVSMFVGATHALPGRTEKCVHIPGPPEASRKVGIVKLLLLFGCRSSLLILPPQSANTALLIC